VAITHSESPVAGTRKRANYNAAEQQFSSLLQQHLHELLEGKRNVLSLLRRYPGDSDRLGVMITPDSLQRDQLRLPVVEAMTWEAIEFLCSETVGGPVSQEIGPDGALLEFQMFSTKYPHILLERIDRYVDDQVDPTDITWCLRRVQNQRAQTQVNRFLDAANLAFEFLRFVR
jgi:hypothetical protein